MRRIRLISAFAMLATALAVVPASAQTTFDGVFVSDPARCDAVAQSGAAAVFHADFSIFTLEHGIIANAFRCDPTRIGFTTGSEKAVMTAFCEEPALVFPDLLAISEYNETQIALDSLYFSSAAGGVGDTMAGRTLYTRCANLKDLPVD